MKQPHWATTITLVHATTSLHQPAVPSGAVAVAPCIQARRAILAALPSILIGAIWIAYATWSSVAELETFNSTSRDIGVYLQILWNTAHGRPFQTTLLESNRLHLAEHVALLLPVLSSAF